MNDFSRCNKLSGVYWLKEPADNITINVKLKQQDGILLPKFEDYTKDTNEMKIRLENRLKEYSFKWQEKVFSSWEIQRYSDIHTCITDIELNYNEILKDHDHRSNKIFTYIHEDYHLPLPLELKKSRDVGIPNLNACFDLLKLDEYVGQVLGGNTISMKSLFRSEDNIAFDEEQWDAMHVVSDNSDYNEDGKLLLKQETILLSLYFNKDVQYLIVTPDVNNLEMNPYAVEVNGVTLGYQYGVDLQFGSQATSEDLVTMLCKLSKRWEKNHRLLTSFTTPSTGRRQSYLTLELLTAAGFEMDDLYIAFQIKVPEGVDCNGDVHGKTHTSRSITVDNSVQWNFGHIHVLRMEYDIDAEPPTLNLFLEAISSDWWGRHRTEGYSHLRLPTTAGLYTKQLTCSRPQEMDKVAAESRRFFLGGCHLIKDLDVLARPQLQDTSFTYESTGSISVRWAVVSQSASRSQAAPRGPGAGALGGAGAVLAGAEAALAHYRRARARLAKATQQYHCDAEDSLPNR